jgi:Tfp pilus assembly protein FimV
MAIAIAVVLAGTHFTAYKTGRALVAGDWAAEREQTALAVVEAEKAARAKEQELTQKANDVQTKLNAEKKRAAAAAGAAADELRLLEAALAASQAASDSIAPTGANGASTGGLFLESAKAYLGVAAEADQLANKVIGLQGYVANVCQSSPSGKPNGK